MNLDLFKYILRLSVIPMMFISLLLIAHGDADSIDGLNLLGFVLLIITSTIIITDAKNEDE
jgi:hypothetical protein